MIHQHYTTQQVAEKLSVSVDTIKRLIKAKKLTAVKMSNEYRLTEAAVNQYLKSRTLEAKHLK